MTGCLAIKGVPVTQYQSFSVDAESQWPPRFTKLELVFAGGARLAFSDPRRLGRIRVRALPVEAHEPVRSLAQDPSEGMPAVSELAARFAATRAPLKAVLLDQNKLFSGLGNYLCDEVLFQSGLHPEVRCDALDAASVARVHANIKSIVDTAITCLREERPFPAGWLFHNRWSKGKKEAKHDGNIIKFVTVGGRTTAYVPALLALKREQEPQHHEPPGATKVDAQPTQAARKTGPARAGPSKRRAEQAQEEQEQGKKQEQKQKREPQTTHHHLEQQEQEQQHQKKNKKKKTDDDGGQKSPPPLRKRRSAA